MGAPRPPAAAASVHGLGSARRCRVLAMGSPVLRALLSNSESRLTFLM